MIIHELVLFDNKRNREIPVLLYAPVKHDVALPVVIFNPGYQEQKDLMNSNNIMAYRKWEYLAEYFVNKGYAFIALQHDLPGDEGGIETINVNIPQAEARKSLWERGEKNILFAIDELRLKYKKFDFAKFIIAGHSNGGDIARFFTNRNEHLISYVISFDGRRCPIAPLSKQKLLMFEAVDTTTDYGVFPDEGTQNNPKKINLEWMIIKPKNAMHKSYRGDLITEQLKEIIFKSIDFFLLNF